MGRPLSQDPRLHRVCVRLTNSELEEVEAYAERHGMNKGDVLRRGIQLQLEVEEKEKTKK